MRILRFVTGVLLVLPWAGCAESPASVAISGTTMGTVYHVTIAQSPVDMDVDAMRRKIDAELDRLNSQMSTYRSDSEISRFNAQQSTEWFEVSSEFAQLVERARQVSESCDGAFDVTVAPLVYRWNFGPNRTRLDVPSDVEIQSLRRSVGFGKVDTRAEPPALKKQRSDVQLDLSAIAKGFAVDRIAELLESHDLKNFMVEIGGELRVQGTKAEGNTWTVGIEKPVAHQQLMRRVVRLRDVAMATSGDYRNFIEIDGRRYSHMIDPRTGNPIDGRLASVSVIASDCVSADAWATMLMVLGPDDGYDFAEREGLAASFLQRVDTEFVERVTDEFERIVTQSSAPPPSRY